MSMRPGTRPLPIIIRPTLSTTYPISATLCWHGNKRAQSPLSCLPMIVLATNPIPIGFAVWRPRKHWASKIERPFSPQTKWPSAVFLRATHDIFTQWSKRAPTYFNDLPPLNTLFFKISKRWISHFEGEDTLKRAPLFFENSCPRKTATGLCGD